VRGAGEEKEVGAFAPTPETWADLASSRLHTFRGFVDSTLPTTPPNDWRGAPAPCHSTPLKISLTP